MGLGHMNLHKRQQGGEVPPHRHGDGGGPVNGGGPVATAVPIVYHTQTPTWSGGSVWGYTTIGVTAAPTPQPEPTPKPEPTSVEPITFDSSASEASRTPDSEHSTSLFDSLAPTAANSVPTSPVATDSFAAATNSSSVSAASASSGLSSGAVAGIVIGILAILGLIAGLGIFAWRRKRAAADDDKQRAENEKNPFGDSAAAPPPPAAFAPLSNIPPPTAPGMVQSRNIPSEQFFNGPAMSGAMIGGAAAGAGAASMAASRSNLTLNEPLQQPPLNPFAEHNASQPSLHSIPIGAAEADTHPPSTSGSDMAALGATIASAATAQRPAASPSMTQGPPRPPFAAGPVPGSPAASTFSVDSTASAAAMGAPGRPNGPAVHRVQLDFRGSMHDELDVRIGDVVAIVHEYDDGWVLARKLDKSKQGVCPRSCLSPRPLQPRRGPPPPGAPRGPPPPRTASPAPSNGPGPAMGRASPAPSNRGPPGGPGPMRTASPAPGSGPGPMMGRASPAPGPMMGRASPAPGSRSQSPALNPNLNNWPAKPINASTITPNMNQWPMKPTNAPPGGASNMVKRSMSPGPYGGGPSAQSQRPYGPTKRRSNSMGNVPQPRPVVPGFPGADRMTGMSDRSADDSMNLPIQSPGSPVARKPVPGLAS